MRKHFTSVLNSTDVIYWTDLDYEAAADAEPADPDYCSQKVEILGRNTKIMIILHTVLCAVCPSHPRSQDGRNEHVCIC